MRLTRLVDVDEPPLIIERDDAVGDAGQNGVAGGRHGTALVTRSRTEHAVSRALRALIVHRLLRFGERYHAPLAPTSAQDCRSDAAASSASPAPRRPIAGSAGSHAHRFRKPASATPAARSSAMKLAFGIGRARNSPDRCRSPSGARPAGRRHSPGLRRPPRAPKLCARLMIVWQMPAFLGSVPLSLTKLRSSLSSTNGTRAAARTRKSPRRSHRSRTLCRRCAAASRSRASAPRP